MSAINGSARPPPPAAGSSLIPGFLLLDTTARISDLRNETTAAALTDSGLAVQVSFAVADPPRLSSCCVFCPNRDETPFAYAPRVVCSVEDTALIRVGLTAGGSSPLYFLYRARGPKTGGPSLDLLRDIYQYSLTENLFLPLGFVSRGDNRNHFVMAALSRGTRDGQYYNLHTLGSEPHSTWSKKLLQVEIPDGLTAKSAVIHPTNVISLGGGLLGWVDLWKGIMICDVLDPAATKASFVPMPKLLPSNSELYGNQYSARPLRDVAFSGGYIWCVEFEELVKLRPTIVPVVPDPWDRDELHDSELVVVRTQEEEEVYDVVGWRLITWYRALTCNGWRKGSTVHSDEVGTVSLPQVGGGASALEVPFKDLKTAAPTMGGDDDVVYLVSMLDELDKTAWIVTVDTKSKSLGEVIPFSAENGSLPYYPTYIPSVLTKYLDANSDGALVGVQNACHAAPRNFNMPEKKRQRLSQAEPEEQEPVSQLLQRSSANT